MSIEGPDISKQPSSMDDKTGVICRSEHRVIGDPFCCYSCLIPHDESVVSKKWHFKKYFEGKIVDEPKWWEIFSRNEIRIGESMAVEGYVMIQGRFGEG
jgi:hypothetical protein